jgi:hypothetical protein
MMWLMVLQASSFLFVVRMQLQTLYPVSTSPVRLLRLVSMMIGVRSGSMEQICRGCMPQRYERSLLSLEQGYDIFINCSWVVTQWQYTFIHKQYVEQHK